MTAALHAFAQDEAPARRLALALGVDLALVDLHVFPDGECLPTVPACASTVLVYCALDHPDAKLLPLLLACDAWRRGGVRRLVLVAPYMPYMRQDMVFAPGEPLSRDVVGRLLGERFDRIVTVEPHLHRTVALDPVFCDRQVTVLSAALPLARAIGSGAGTLVIGPDAESTPWANALAAHLGADHLNFDKVRLGDRAVELRLSGAPELRGRRAVLIDDICSSGTTLLTAARHLVDAGVASVEVAVVHALFDADAQARLHASGVARIVSTDSCPHPTNAVELAPLLASALRAEVAG
jgi:ribose-phosphate pyrophosphokinase